MLNVIFNLNLVLQALIAGLFTFSITVIGAAVVFIFKNKNKKFMNINLSLSAGIMLAASFFSLLMPSIKMSEELKLIPWLIVLIGFTLGSALLFFSDLFFKRIIKNNIDAKKRCYMIFSSITLHNIPEGMAVGVAFGSVLYHLDGATIIAAWTLALSIAIQNFPEGSAISLPLYSSGMKKKKAFMFSVLSAIVEPISSVIGAVLVMKIRILLPILLAFAAGAMIYVVVKEIIPESQNEKNNDLIGIYAIIGFVIMMVLDLSLG